MVFVIMLSAAFFVGIGTSFTSVKFQLSVDDSGTSSSGSGVSDSVSLIYSGEQCSEDELDELEELLEESEELEEPKELD